MSEAIHRYGAAKLVLALRQYGITDRALSDAIEKTPREPFVAPPYADLAWENIDLPIDCGQTQTRPILVAAMIEMLAPKKDSIVLEIGTGTGYSAALMARFCRRVHTVERYSSLKTRACQSLDQLGVSRVHVELSDGRFGLPRLAPFDRILINGSVEILPPDIVRQLGVGGILVAPIDFPSGQRVVRFERQRDGALKDIVGPVSTFTPLEQGVAVEM